MIARDRGIAALQFTGDLSYHQCSIFLPSLEPIQAVGRGERSLCVGSWMGCVAEVAEPRALPRHRPVGPALHRIGLWALSRPSAHIRACCRACGTSPLVVSTRYRLQTSPVRSVMPGVVPTLALLKFLQYPPSETYHMIHIFLFASQISLFDTYQIISDSCPI